MSYKILVNGGASYLGSSSVSLKADSQIDQGLTMINNSLYGYIQ